MKVKIWGARGSIPTPIRPEDIKEKIISAMLGITKVEDSAFREELISAILDAPNVTHYALANSKKEAAVQKLVAKQRKVIETYLDNLSPLAGGTASGNTPCIEIQCDRHRFIIDAGSGIRELGLELMNGKCGRGEGVLHLFFSHPHWDHIQGFPFFRPAFVPGNKIFIYSVHDLELALRRQQEFISFPVSLDYMAAEFHFRRLNPEEVLDFGEVRIRNIRNDHPGDAYSYRFEKGNKVFVYASDASYPEQADLRSYINFFADADLLIFDTQFTQRESDEKEDWGHSSSFMGVELAHQANVKRLLLYHYDPTYSDTEMEKILADTLKFQENQYPGEEIIDIMIAKEGQVFDLTPPETTHLRQMPDSDTVILTPSGIFNEHVAADLKTQVDNLKEDDRFPTHLIIDMARVEMLQVAGLRALVKLRKIHTGIVLVGPSINVQQLIDLANYRGFFAIYSSIEAALDELQTRRRSNLPGQTIKNRYYLEQKLGDGRLGSVFKAIDIQLQRPVAVKVLSASFSKEAIEQFLHQARQLIELDNPYIANIFDCDEDLGVSFMVEEFVEGSTLSDLIKKYPNQPLPLDLSLGIAERITQALEYAHSHGVVHGDLKPKNLLLNEKQLKISDFGLGRLESGKSLLNIDVPLALVTAAYLAPEQVLGHPLDARTDLYALGIILYELFTGQLPFTGSDKQVMEQHLSTPPKPLREVNAHLSPLLEHFILKLLDKDPNKRYASARQVRQILASITVMDRNNYQQILYPRQPLVELISRAKFLQQLNHLWAITRQGHGCLVFVTGESGFGKSRLIHEFAHQTSGVTLLMGNFDSQKRFMPYQPFFEAMQTYLAHVAPNKANRKISRLFKGICRVAEQFFDNGGATTSPLETILPPAEVTTLAEALQAATAEQPGLLLLDDLHWADSSSLYLLDYLGQCCRDMPLMIVATYSHTHAEQNPFLGNLLKRYAAEGTISLARLHKDAVKDFLANLWNEDIPPEIIKTIIRLSHGNPLYVEQLAHCLADEEVVRWQNGQWHFEAFDPATLPASIDEIIPRRIRRLSKEIQTLLSQAAVLGNSFHYADLYEMSYLPEKNVLQSLDITLEKQLLKADPNRGVLYFSHATIQQAFYNKLSPSERRRMHYEAGEALERRYLPQTAAARKNSSDAPMDDNGDNTNQFVLRPIISLLAYHFSQVDEPDKVAHYSHQAAQLAERFQAYHQALEWYSRSLNALAKLDTPENLNQRFTLLLAKERVYQKLGELNQQAETLNELQTMLNAGEAEPLKQALWHQRQAIFEQTKGQLQEARKQAELSLAVAQQTKDASLQGSSLLQLGHIALAQENPMLARQIFEEAHRILHLTDNLSGQAEVLNGLGLVYQQLQDYRQAEEHYQRALSLYQGEHYWLNQAATLNNLGRLYLATQSLAEAKFYSQRAWEINRILGYLPGITQSEAILAEMQAADPAGNQSEMKEIMTSSRLRREQF